MADSDQKQNKNPILLVHGYSDSKKSFRPWKKYLAGLGYQVESIAIADYKTLTNEVTVKDIAEAFDWSLQEVGIGPEQHFDAIVHSTGMLVIRSWLTTYAERKHRLDHLIGLAPATWGSPLAHKGRSWLGAVFKGNHNPFDPDFMDVGDRVLDALELGSRFTWDLAHLDLFGEKPYYGPDADTPWVFTLCGIEDYEGLRSVVNEPGMDGTVRWAGCALNSRKIFLDLAKRPDQPARFRVHPNLAKVSPFVPIEGVNHGTILEPSKSQDLGELVAAALKVGSAENFSRWQAEAEQRAQKAFDILKNERGRWQQFVVRALDERGDPITDYYLELYSDQGRNLLRNAAQFNVDIHAYGADPSFRCFHLDLNQLDGVDETQLKLRVVASTSSTLVRYTGWDNGGDAPKSTRNGVWSADIDLKPLADHGTKVFFPFTTTLIELTLNREPTPEVCRLIAGPLSDD